MPGGKMRRTEEMDWLAVIVIGYILISAHRGFRIGLLRMLFSISSLIITIVFLACFTPMLGNAIYKSAFVQLKEQCEQYLRSRLLLQIDGSQIAQILIYAGAGLICFVIISVVMLRMKWKLKKNIEKSVLHVPDMVLGLLIGVLKSMIVVWACFYMIELTQVLEFSKSCLEQIRDNSILLAIYQNNIVKQILSNFLK